MGEMPSIKGYSLKNRLNTGANSIIGYSREAIAMALARQKAVKDIHGYDNVNVLDGDQMEEPAGLGIPVFMSLTFEKKEYEYRGVNKTSPAMRIPCCIVEVSGTKNIVETVVFGRKGTVKEHISFGDYQVNIKGILSNDDDKYPYLLQNDLRRILECPFQVSITHTILNRMGIMDVVIKNFAFPFQEGKTNIVGFELNCSSDEAFEMKLKSEEDIKRV